MGVIYKKPDMNITGEISGDGTVLPLPLIEAKTPRVELRKARASDAAFIADVVLAAMGHDVFSPEVLSSGTTPFGTLAAVREALTRICAKEDTLYSWKNTCVATYCGKTAGALISYDGAEYAETADRTFTLISKALKVEKPQPGEETSAGEWYLDSLAVHPEYRGHGIGAILIQNSLDEAQAAGYGRATLIVDKEKPGLHSLYARLGFEDECEIMFFGEPYVRMVQYI